MAYDGRLQPGTLIHDADCGFCQRMLRVGRRAGISCPDLPSVALTDAQLRAWELDRTDVDEAVWFVGPQIRLRGHEAIAAALGTSNRRSVRALGRTIGSSLLRPIAAPAYAWVARHRHRLPGGTPACELSASRPPEVTRPPPTPHPPAGEGHR